jgi:glycerophosphoryl diester phosphodiesterase
VTGAPLVVAHRGASAHAPENTIAAFEAAVRFGADGVELDVRATADGALAVHHDPALADGREIHELLAAELPPEVCDLAGALAACGDLLVNVEIKADRHGIGLALAAPVVEACRAWGGRVLVSSFDAATIDEVRRLDPGVPTAQLTFLALLNRTTEEVIAWIAERGHAAWHPLHAMLEEQDVGAAHAAGLAVNTWTVDDPARVGLLAGWGVDAIVTNDVPATMAALGPRATEEDG